MHLLNAPGYAYDSAAISADVGDGITLCYTAADLTRKPGHQHWCKPDTCGANIAASYFDPCVKETAGVVYLVRWDQLERTKGACDFSLVLAALDRCQRLGKRMIVRVFRQTWDDRADPPSHPPVPADIYNDPAQFGRLLKIVNGGQLVGWGADLSNANTRARFIAFLQSMAVAVGGHPAFVGWALDESNTILNAGATPTSSQILNALSALYEVYDGAAAAFGPSRVYPMVNHLEGASFSRILDLHTWCCSRGMPIAISDTYLQEMMGPRLMPVYRVLPVYDRPTLVHVDIMTIRAADAGLQDRVNRAAGISYALGATYTAWATIGGANSPQWAAVRNVLAA